MSEPPHDQRQNSDNSHSDNSHSDSQKSGGDISRGAKSARRENREKTHATKRPGQNNSRQDILPEETKNAARRANHSALSGGAVANGAARSRTQNTRSSNTRSSSTRKVAATSQSAAKSQVRSDARRIALRGLVQLESDDAPLSSLLENQNGDAASRSFARELATGTTRHRARIDWTIAPLLKKSLAKLDAPVRNALRLAAYERIVLGTPHAVVADQYAELMRGEKLKSAVAFVNAVARKLPENWRASPSIDKEAARHLSIETSHPLWLVERWIARIGFDKTRDLCLANNQIAPLSLRVNNLKTTRHRVLETLRSRGLEAREGELSPHAILVEGAGSPEIWPEWTRGEIIAQDEAAQLVAFVVAPQEHSFVVDMASAPGGKTTHLAQLMNDKGHIWARDRSEGRLKLVRQNAARLGLTCIATQAVDGLDAAQNASDPTQGDALLLDAPCLGTGTLRRRPDAKWRKTPQMLAELVQLQRELLDVAALKVRVGGVLVYSTCSLEPEENEEQIHAFLLRHANWEIDDAQEVRPEILKLRGDDRFWRTRPTSEVARNAESEVARNAEKSALSDIICSSDNGNFVRHSRPDGMFAARLKRVR